jgi:hypothetical protein
MARMAGNGRALCGGVRQVSEDGGVLFGECKKADGGVRINAQNSVLMRAA